MSRLTGLFRKKLGIDRQDPFSPLLDAMDKQHEDGVELGKRVTSEAVNAARLVVLPSLARQLWPIALGSGVIVGAVVTGILTYVQSSEYAAWVVQIEAQVNERVEKMADARAEQIASERLRKCEVNSAGKSSDAQQMLYLAWSMALPGRTKTVDDARRIFTGLGERDLALTAHLATQIQRGNIRFVIGVILKMSPAE